VSGGDEIGFNAREPMGGSIKEKPTSKYDEKRTGAGPKKRGSHGWAVLAGKDTKMRGLPAEM